MFTKPDDIFTLIEASTTNDYVDRRATRDFSHKASDYVAYITAIQSLSDIGAIVHLYAKLTVDVGLADRNSLTS